MPKRRLTEAQIRTEEQERCAEILHLSWLAFICKHLDDVGLDSDKVEKMIIDTEYAMRGLSKKEIRAERQEARRFDARFRAELKKLPQDKDEGYG